MEHTCIKQSFSQLSTNSRDNTVTRKHVSKIFSCAIEQHMFISVTKHKQTKEHVTATRLESTTQSKEHTRACCV